VLKRKLKVHLCFTGAVGTTLFMDFMVFKIVLVVKYSSWVNGLVCVLRWARRRDQLPTEHTISTPSIHALSGIRNCYPSNQAAAKLLLRSHDHRIRPLYTIPTLILQI